MLMNHGDDKGLILPPKVAPIHVVIVPIARDDNRALVMEKADGLAAALREIRYEGEPLGVKVDGREGFRPGYKFAHWELRGVPLRIEIGPRDIGEGVAVLANRLSGEKQNIAVDYATFAFDTESISLSLEEIQAQLTMRSRNEMEGRIFEVDSYDEFKAVIAGGKGFVKAPWDGTAETEAKVKAETTATTRLLLPESAGHTVKCLFTGTQARCLAYFAASY